MALLSAAPACAAGRSRIAAPTPIRRGDLLTLPAEDASCDAAWTSHVLHGLDAVEPALAELARVVKPGGVIAVREDRVLDRFLPLCVDSASTGLEERAMFAYASRFLVPTPSGTAGGSRGWLDALRDSGLRDVEARSYLYEFNAPLSAMQLGFLRARLQRWSSDTTLSVEDRTTAARLADPADALDIGRRTDICFVSVATVYFGKLPTT